VEGNKIKIDKISKTFSDSDKKIQVLDNINININEGEFISLIGPSGCGKSTLLRILAGLEKQSTGHVYSDNEEIIGPSPNRGLCFQSFALFPWKTVKQNIEFGPKSRGVPKKEYEKITKKYIKLVGLTEFADNYPHEISGGMQQRASLARLFANDPEILLLDEPLGSLDAQTREILQEELLFLWRTFSKTVLNVTHSVSEAVFLSDRIIIFSKRPARIKEIIVVDLDRPRNGKTRTCEEFFKICSKIGKILREEQDDKLFIQKE